MRKGRKVRERRGGAANTRCWRCRCKRGFGGRGEKAGIAATGHWLQAGSAVLFPCLGSFWEGKGWCRGGKSSQGWILVGGGSAWRGGHGRCRQWWCRTVLCGAVTVVLYCTSMSLGAAAPVSVMQTCSNGTGSWRVQRGGGQGRAGASTRGALLLLYSGLLGFLESTEEAQRENETTCRAVLLLAGVGGATQAKVGDEANNNAGTPRWRPWCIIFSDRMLTVCCYCCCAHHPQKIWNHFVSLSLQSASFALLNSLTARSTGFPPCETKLTQKGNPCAEPPKVHCRRVVHSAVVPLSQRCTVLRKQPTLVACSVRD